MDRHRFRAEVFSLDDIGSTGARIVAELKIPVFSLRSTSGGARAAGAMRLLAHLRGTRPHIVQTWMYHANLVGGIAGRALGRPVIWNIRRGSLAHLKRRTLLISHLCSLMSSEIPARIICCSSDSLERHVAAGYVRARMTVIPNGFDNFRFQPNATLRKSFRQEMGVSPEVPLVGLIARFDPAKDHETFLRAAAVVHTQCPSVRFLLCGKDVDSRNRRLMNWIDAMALRDCCLLLGVRDDVPRILAGLDVLVSSSICEGFPNVLGEAMAVGVPCVATDVGDSALVVGDTGRLVPPHNSDALAAACLELMKIGPQGRSNLGAAARLRIQTHFSLVDVTAQYENLYAKVLEACAA